MNSHVQPQLRNEQRSDRRARNRRAFLWGGIQLSVFLLGFCIIASQGLVLLSSSVLNSTTPAPQNELESYLVTPAFRICLGPYLSVAGLTEDHTVYGFLSSVCSNTSSITLWCLTGREVKCPRTPFVVCMGMLARKENAFLLLSWCKRMLSRVCQVVNAFSTSIAILDWILAPVVYCQTAKVVRQALFSCLLHAKDQICQVLFTSYSFSRFAVLFSAATVILVTYVSFTKKSSRLEHLQILCNLWMLFVAYSGLGLLVRVLSTLLGVFVETFTFFVCTFCNEQLLLYTCCRLIDPTLTAALLPLWQRVATLTWSFLAGLAIHFSYGRLLDNRTIGHLVSDYLHMQTIIPDETSEQAALHTKSETLSGLDGQPSAGSSQSWILGQPFMRLKERLLRFKSVSHSLPFSSCKPIRSKPNSRGRLRPSAALRHSRVLYWVLICGCFTFSLPSFPPISIIAEAFYWSFTNHKYTELRTLYPFYQPTVLVMPFVILQTQPVSSSHAPGLSDEKPSTTETADSSFGKKH